MHTVHMKRLLFGGVAGLLAAGVLTLSPAAASASTRTMRPASSVMTSGWTQPLRTATDAKRRSRSVPVSSSTAGRRRWAVHGPGGTAWEGI